MSSSYEMTGDFQKEVLEKSHELPVLVDFWAEWCAPCRTLGPVLERLVDEADGAWALVKIDTEKHQDIATRFSIQSIPAVKLFDRGEEIAEFVGALPEARIRNWLEEHLGGPTTDALATARVAIESADLPALRASYDAIRSVDPDTEPVAHLQHLLEVAGSSGQSTEGLPPAEATYIRAATAMNEGDLDTALTAWIEVVETDRKIDDDGARRACIALFYLLGEDHALTQQHRRRFSMALSA